MENGTFRLAAVGDLHCRQEQHGRFRELVKMVNGEAEGLVLAGDLTDHGMLEEAKTLADSLALLRVPCAAVLGNHDFDAGSVKELVKILQDANVQVLDGDHAIFDKRLGIAGVKGFAGGFDHGLLQAFGEPSIKVFVQEVVNEALKLEAALAQIDNPRKIVLMHYAPAQETCAGERAEILPFLGSSRLAAPCDTFGAVGVFHGHAHHGTFETKTAKGTPVYNVSMPVLKKMFEVKFRLFDVTDHGCVPVGAQPGAPELVATTRH